MGFHRVSFWSVDDGAATSSAFTVLQDAAVTAGGSVSEPWSVQIAIQRSGAVSNDPSELLERRTGDATKDLHVVTSTDDPTQLVLVHRHGRTVLEAETGAKSLLDSYLKYKTRATLHLDGLLYTNGGDFRIALARATQRPSNRFIGIVVDIEAMALTTAAAANGILDEMTQLFREAAQSETPTARLQDIDVEVDRLEYGIAEDASRQQWALQLVQFLGA